MASQAKDSGSNPDGSTLNSNKSLPFSSRLIWFIFKRIFFIVSEYYSKQAIIDVEKALVKKGHDVKIINGNKNVINEIHIVHSLADIKNMDDDYDSIKIPEKIFKNKSTIFDAIFQRVKTDKWDNFYENFPTKLSNKLDNNIKLVNILKQIYRIYCNVLAPFHILPDFLILAPGACGTTSMLELYLRSNKEILPSKVNEITYFDQKHNKPVNWYKMFFPTILTKKIRQILGKKTLTGEATGGYILNPNAPIRIKKIMPKVKLVVMIRNPVDRTLSHYKRRVRITKEKQLLEDLIEHELKHFDEEFEEYINNEKSISRYPLISYLTSSKYSQHIEHWLKIFPKEQFLFINANEYFKNPLKEYNKILKFLGLPPHYPKISGQRGISPKGIYNETAIKPQTIEYLKNYFIPHNKRLFELINEEYNWN